MMSRSLASLPPPRSLSASSGPIASSEIPHFTIDLDRPAASRWSEIITHYKPYWHTMVESMWAEFEDLHGEHFESAEEEEEEEAPKKAKKRKKPKMTPAEKAAKEAAKHAEHVAFATKLASQLMVALRAQGLAVYADELESVASLAGIELHELVLLNLSYEAHGGCTTILTPTADGHVLMGRTLDWQQPMLKHITIELSFIKEGKLLYRATSFAGFLGIFTGHKPHAYSIAVNFRCCDGEGHADEDDDDDDGAGASAGDESIPDFSWPVGFLVRHTLETCSDYASAADRLHRCTLMSQVYFIIAGTKTHEAEIITRETEGSVRPIRMKNTNENQGEASGDATSNKKAVGIGKRDSNQAASAAAASSSASSVFQTGAISACPSSSIPPIVPSPHPWLVQANMDHWLTLKRQDHQDSLRRTKLVNQTLAKAKGGGETSASVTEADMWRLMAIDPIWDEETIYATVSVPATDRFVTLIENPHPTPAKTKKTAKSSKYARRR